ncbi:MAG: penicillin-binding protein 2 [Clostridia bacterium]|nr:penicillin-binding protein 2 [Clostridia bacterium]
MEAKVIQRKLNIFTAIVFILFLVLIGRVGYLQFFFAEKFNLESMSNRLRMVAVPAARGEIKDRNGNILVKNKQAYNISLSLIDLQKEDRPRVYQRLAEVVGIPVNEVERAVYEQPVNQRHEPVIILSDVSFDIVTRVEEHKNELDGVSVDVEPIRYYPYGDFAPHVLGYLRQVGDEEYNAFKEKYPDEQYRPSDRFGRAGLEKTFESELHGLDGARRIEINSRGRAVRELGIKDPTPGNDLLLTLDKDVQVAAEQALVRTMERVQKEFKNAKAGAVVLIDVRTGAIIAMASKPGYDPNRFLKPIPAQEWNTNFSDNLPFPPLLNRNLQVYPPGSTFKMVTAVAALENGWHPEREIRDPGYFMSGGRAFKCWNIRGHGTVDLEKSLQVSCNVFYFNVGRTIGHEKIAQYARAFGLGEKTGVSLPSEMDGNVPDSKWKKEVNESLLNNRYKRIYQQVEDEYAEKINKAANPEEKEKLVKERDRKLANKREWYRIEYDFNTKWQHFDTLNMSIGQGNNLYSPLQLANFTAAIANGGTLWKPYLVDKIIGPDGGLVKELKPEVLKKVPASANNLALVRKGMLAVTQPGGTAAGIFAGFPIKVAGKTGTAQTGKDRDNHGLFVGFAPYDNPQVAVAAIVEYGGSGGATAGVISREVLAAYFKVKTEQKEVVNRGMEE